MKLKIISVAQCPIKERNGFLKYVCDYDSDNRIDKFKCWNTEEFYFQDKKRYGSFYTGQVCSQDPLYYQACDKASTDKITNNELLCGSYLCKYRRRTIYTRYIIHPSYKLREGGFICDGRSDCENTDLDEIGCDPDEEMTTMLSGNTAYTKDICDDECDAKYCEDEAVCNGYTYALYCISVFTGSLIYVPLRYICIPYPSFCLYKDNMANCTITENTQHTCKHSSSGEIVPVHNFTRCSSIINKVFHPLNIYCDYYDQTNCQTNCSDPSRVGVTCDVNGYKSTLSIYLICLDEKIKACDDQIESKCFSTKTCKIHKHLMCNDKRDCEDGSDESHSTCLSRTEATCKRRVGKDGDLPIPISWLEDGVKDCEDGEDETADWPRCGIGKTLRYVPSNKDVCKNALICPWGNPGYVELSDLCDGLESCGNENQICLISRSAHDIVSLAHTTNKGLTKRLSYCHKGLKSMELLKDACIEEHHIYPDHDYFGVETKTSVFIPRSKQSCDHLYGENYVYTSCTGRCISASCPLRNIPRYEVCPDQFASRIGTITNGKYLAFFTKSFGNIYSNRYFVCNNKKRCVGYDKVCNLVDDCGDSSDEDHCSNHFKCNSSCNFIPKSKKCDGNVDCLDLSDECNEDCSKQLLESILLKGLSWLIGSLAVFSNIVIIIKSLVTLKSCKTSVAMTNRCLIILIALGDFLVGCYLVMIAIYDGIAFKRSYCLSQITWITSLTCSAVGIFSTIGSQVSLFAMTGLSVIRLHGIWNSMRVPGEVNMKKSLQVAAAMFSLVLASAAIAVIPVIKKLENVFVNGVKFLDDLKIFIGTPDKEKVFDVIKAYYGRTKEATLKWDLLIKMARNMFSRDFDYEDHTERVAKVDFYGNDGVCLFKYFVQNDDPQKSFVWGILALNFICFLFISLSYLLIGISSRRSSKSVAGSNNRQMQKRNRRMNQKIAIIIVTDFLCWIPFIVICFLHSVGVLDATPWYALFSMVILPINSVINPLLYDDVLTEAIRRPSRVIWTRISSSTVYQRAREWFNPAPTETVELETIEMRESKATTSASNRTGELKKIGSAPKIPDQSTTGRDKELKTTTEGDRNLRAGRLIQPSRRDRRGKRRVKSYQAEVGGDEIIETDL